MSETILKVEDLKTSFMTSSGEVQAVRGVSFEVHKGEILGIVGESGSGKSVTSMSILRLLADTARIKNGKIEFEGTDLTKVSDKQMREIRGQKIAMVFQDPMTGTAATMQIEENLALAARRGKRRGLRIGITKAERERYRELLKSLDLGLEDRLTARVGLLSGGQRQALTLLMATMNKPKLLLLDRRSGPQDGAQGADPLGQDCGGEPPDHHDDHPQHEGCHQVWQPPDHDDEWKNRCNMLLLISID